MVRAHELADLAQRLRLAEIRPDAPGDLAGAVDDREEARLPAADDHVLRRESRVAGIVPAVRAEVSGRVDVHPVERAARLAEADRRANHRAGVVGEAELVDVLAGLPLPDDLPVWRHLDQPIVLEQRV